MIVTSTDSSPAVDMPIIVSNAKDWFVPEIDNMNVPDGILYKVKRPLESVRADPRLVDWIVTVQPLNGIVSQENIVPLTIQPCSTGPTICLNMQLQNRRPEINKHKGILCVIYSTEPL